MVVKLRVPKKRPRLLNKLEQHIADLPGEAVLRPKNSTIIGRITRPVGVRGEVKAYSESHHPDRLFGLKAITVRIRDGYRKLDVLDTRQVNGQIRLLLKGIESPEEASILTGCEIVVSGDERPDMLEDEYYVDDLIGCRAVADDNTELGIIREVLAQAHHDLWVIDGPIGEVLVPAVKEYIIDVDLHRHMVVIRRVEGLWVDE